jgi:hypothetical protein
MMNKTMHLNYPALDENNEYQQEIARLNRFNAELADTQAELEAVRVELLKPVVPKSSETMIAEAEMLLTDSGLETTIERRQVLLKKASYLQKGIVAQRSKCERIKETLSSELAAHFKQEHKNRARRVIAALEELHAANEYEFAFHTAVTKLGYDQKTPAWRFEPPGQPVDPFDKYGGFAPSWYRDAQGYARTDA